jgi:hypothetical protein
MLTDPGMRRSIPLLTNIFRLVGLLFLILLAVLAFVSLDFHRPALPLAPRYRIQTEATPQGRTFEQVPPAGFRVKSLQFFSTMSDRSPAQSHYGYKFYRDKARTIYTAVSAVQLAPGKSLEYPLRFVYYRPDGGVLVDTNFTMTFEANQDSINFGIGCGYDDPQKWIPGLYRLEVLYEGIRVAEDTFEIVEK